MKKKSLLVLGMIMSLTLAAPAPAYAANVNSGSVLESGTPILRAEQLEWRYRSYNGKLQKRCWSITYGYWKTGWMNV